MADLSDVLDAIGGVIAGVLYPDGTRYASAVGERVTIVSGWPNKTKLDDALKAKQVYISVFPPPNLERDRTRMMSQWQAVAPPRHTVTASVSGRSVTLGGTMQAGQNVGIIAGTVTAVCPVQAIDSPARIAAALAATLTAQGVSATSAGAVLTVPGTGRLEARVGGSGKLVKEVERTDRAILVTVWAPSPALRTAVARLIRTRLSDPKFITLADGSAGWIRYERTNDDDGMERADLYKRDLSYWVEFGQYLVEDAYEVILPQPAMQPARPDGSPLGPPNESTV